MFDRGRAFPRRTEKIPFKISRIDQAGGRLQVVRQAAGHRKTTLAFDPDQSRTPVLECN
jgi:hypothetical protein